LEAARRDAAERATVERHATGIEGRAQKASDERDALAAALETGRRDSAAALKAAEARAAAAEAKRATAEQNQAEAEGRAEEATAERDDLAVLLEAAKTSVKNMYAAVEERLVAIEAKRARTNDALDAAEARAEVAIAERDALAGELDVMKTG